MESNWQEGTTLRFDPITGTVSAALTCRVGMPLLSGLRKPDNSIPLPTNGESQPMENGLHGWTSFNDNSRVFTEIRYRNQSVTFRQRAESQIDGIAGCYFSIEIPDENAVLIPTWNGVRLTKDNPLFWDGWTNRVEIGLVSLQFPMLILEGKTGGFLLYAEDVGEQFKAFSVQHEHSSFRIQVETIPQAPFADIHEFSTITWHLLPYMGEWCQAAEIYRSLLTESYGLDEANTHRPAWTSDIRFFCLFNTLERDQLQALAAHTDPSRVLLHIPGWRKERYDVNWPDLTPIPSMAERIAYAHQLGFKVQLHCNMNGFQQELPGFAAYADHQCRDKFTEELIYADYQNSAGEPFKFAQMNPASAKWRHYLIERIVKAVTETGADAIHLDESLFARNDQNGRIDGLTSQQGNVLLHRELAEALPDIAIGGEGITECNAQYAVFLQSHVYAVDDVGTYIANQIEQIVPLTCAVMRDYIRPYHWPGYPQAKREHAFLLWHLTGQATGLFPTLMRDTAEALGEQPAPCLKAVIAEANFLRDQEARHRFDGLGNGVLMRWQLKDGTVAASVRTKEGYAFLPNETKPEAPLYRIRLDGDNHLSMLYD